jgi:hypothetical protein
MFSFACRKFSIAINKDVHAGLPASAEHVGYKVNFECSDINSDNQSGYSKGLCIDLYQPRPILVPTSSGIGSSRGCGDSM